MVVVGFVLLMTWKFVDDYFRFLHFPNIKPTSPSPFRISLPTHPPTHFSYLILSCPPPRPSSTAPSLHQTKHPPTLVLSSASWSGGY
ncbi:hypothetical protein BaRGS_00001243, partial [Batillaria attramentaria]